MTKILSLLLLLLFNLVSIFKTNDLNDPTKIETEELIKFFFSSANKFENVLNHPIDLFVPKFDFQNPLKYQAKNYDKITEHLISPPKSQVNMKDLFIFPENIINDSENNFKIELLNNLIRKEINMDESRYGTQYNIFGFPNSLIFQNIRPKLLEHDHTTIKNFNELGDIIAFEPKTLNIIDK